MAKRGKFELSEGSAGNDVMVGGGARDWIEGGDGRDELYGGDGADRLFGGNGDDFLSGGRGTDRLTGGDGADTFCFDGDFGDDHAVDFDAAEGDSFTFILYENSQRDWTGADMLAMCGQNGDNVVLLVANSDERVTLWNTDLSDLTAEMFRTVFYEAPDLVA